jgi:hypothetical protein
MKCPECRILHHLSVGGPRRPPDTRLIFLPPILKILPPIQNSTDNTDRTRNKVILVPGNAQNAGFYTI